MKTDWSKYAKCGLCAVPEGAACTNVDGSALGRPHAGRKRAVNWFLYEDCPTCSQPPGKACLDTRYARSSGTFRMDSPHRRRGKAAK